MALTIEQLTQIATEFLRKEYELPLDIPIKRNNRLRTSLGRFVETYDDKQGSYTPNRIEISGKTFEYGADEAVIDILKHELIHYAMAVSNMPYDDGHEVFEAELRKHGVSSTEENSIGPAAYYTCNKCGNIDYTGNTRIVRELERGVKAYRTNCCDAYLTYMKTVILDGTRSVNECLTDVS